MRSKTPYVPLHSVKTKEMHALGFDILQLTEKPEKSYDSSVPHRHNYYELFVFVKGGGKHEIDFNKYDIADNTLHMVSPGQIHTLYQGRANGYVICFSEEFLLQGNAGTVKDRLRIFDRSHASTIKIPAQHRREIFELSEKIYNEYRTYTADVAGILYSYLNILLLKIKQFDAAGDVGHSRTQTLVDQFKSLLEKQYLSTSSVSDYAKLLGITSNYLNSLCRETEGKPASQLIDDRLMLEAKRLLYRSEKNIQQTALYLGFQNVPYFSRWFKKQSGLSPAEFRSSSR